MSYWLLTNWLFMCMQKNLNIWPPTFCIFCALNELFIFFTMSWHQYWFCVLGLLSLGRWIIGLYSLHRQKNVIILLLLILCSRRTGSRRLWGHWAVWQSLMCLMFTAEELGAGGCESTEQCGRAWEHVSPVRRRARHSRRSVARSLRIMQCEIYICLAICLSISRVSTKG